VLADTSHSENLPTKPSSRLRQKPIAPIQWWLWGGDECEQRTPSLGEERDTHLTDLSGRIPAVDNRHSLGLSCPGFPEKVEINLKGHPPPDSCARGNIDEYERESNKILAPLPAQRLADIEGSAN
jgi:hypothetical protein